jgi:hypothetical protein
LTDSEFIDVSVAFSVQAGKVKFGKLVKSLVEFVRMNQINKGSVFRNNLPEGYCYISISVPTQPLGRWWGAAGFNTVVATKELLESCIAKKNRLEPTYRNSDHNISGVWLLIVNNKFLGAGEVDVCLDHLAEWKFVFNFDKVLLFSRELDGSGEVLELLQI